MTENQNPPDPGESPDDEGSVFDGRDDEEYAAARSHRGDRKGRLGCLVALVVLALVVGVAYVGLTRGADWLRDQFGDPEDYAGPGTGSVQVVVNPGDSTTDIAHSLEQQDVVASADAFKDAASARPDEAGLIQPGTYEFREKMKATDAFEVLVDTGNRVVDRIAIPEGLRVVDVVDILVENTDFSRKQFERALDKPAKLGLPKYANGNAEGYLFPAAYEFGPSFKPVDMLKAMVDRWRQAADSAGLEGAHPGLDYTPGELMTIASLIEAEGRGDDMPKIARVIYNRLENPGSNGTTGRLEIDATVNYALGRNLGVDISSEDLQVDSPYNTRLNPGLPPGPIEAPGDEAIKAALNPADGPWFYYVTVDLKTGETKFAETYEEFLRYKAEFREYCNNSEACS